MEQPYTTPQPVPQPVPQPTSFFSTTPPILVEARQKSKQSSWKLTIGLLVIALVLLAYEGNKRNAKIVFGEPFLPKRKESSTTNTDPLFQPL